MLSNSSIIAWQNLNNKGKILSYSLMLLERDEKIIKMGEWNVRDNRPLGLFNDGCSIDTSKLLTWLKKVDPKLRLNQILLTKTSNREYDPNASEIEVSIVLTCEAPIFQNGWRIVSPVYSASILPDTYHESIWRLNFIFKKNSYMILPDTYQDSIR